MNMMVNTSDLVNEADTEKNNKIAQKKALSKLLAAWESKSAQKAKTFGGLGFLAVSLAACNSGSDDPVAPADPVVPAEPAEPAVVTNTPKALTDSTTADVLVGDGGNDTFNAIASTYADTDQIVDSATDDADVLNMVENAAATPNVRNVETLNIELQNISAVALDVASVVGAKVLNYSRGDLTIASSTVTGDKSVDIDNLDATQIPTVNITGTVTNVDIDGAATDTAGAIINANTATGNVAYSGPGTINAAAATGTVQVDTVANTGEATKATVINAAAATTIFADTLLLGTINIDAAAATTITIENASGGVTVIATKGGTTANGIDIRQIDASGATITTGTYASTAAGTIDLGGTAGTTDAATISGAGSINLDIGVATGAVDNITLGANGANVTYTISSTNGAGTSFSKAAAAAGSQASTFTVTAAGNEDEFAAKTVTGIDVLDLTAGTAGAVDGSLWTPGKVDVGFDNANGAFTYAADSTYEITADQTTGVTLEAASTNVEQTIKVVAGDDNGTSTAVGTIEVNALDLNAGEDAKSGTVTLEAIVANFTATSVDGGAKMSMVVTGDEDVTLGTVTFGASSSFNAATSSGKMNLTTTTLLPTVTTGSGADTLVVNGADVHTVSMNAGNDTLTITNTSESSSFDTGDGADTINVDKATNVYVVAGGAGNDTFTTAVALAGTIAGGDGSADEITIDGAGALTMADSFRMSGMEVFDITAANDTVTLDDESFASDNTLVLQGDAAADIFKVLADSTTGGTIDASGLTVGSGQTVTIQYQGGTKDDTITGGVAAETFIFSGGTDTIEGGGTGTDTYEVTDSTHAAGAFGVATGSDTSVGTVINVGTTAVSSGSIYAGITGYVASGADVAAGKQMHLYAASKTTNDADTVSISGIETFTLGDGTDYFQGGAGDETANGNAGKDYISMGDGNDTIIIDSTAEHATNEQIHGGLGNDTIQLTATTTLSSTDAHISGVEEITMGGTASVTLIGTGQTENFTVNDNTGVSTITMGSGTHTIKLSASDGADDIIVQMHGGDDIVSGFEVGASKDIIRFDISELATAERLATGITLDFVEIHDNNSSTAGALGSQTLTAAATAGDAKNIFLLDNGTTHYADAAAAVDTLEAGGTNALTFSGNIAQEDAFLFAYENNDATLGTTIAVAYFIAADNNSGGAATTGVGNLGAVDLITLQGMEDVTTLTASADNTALI